jgi:hypothetical protein
MNGIKVNGYSLNLPPDSSIRIEQITSLFQTEVFQGSYSFPFELPWSPDNMKALGFPTVIEVSGRVKKFDAELFWKQTKIATCKLVVQKSTRLSITVNLIVGLAALNVFDKKLSEINLGADIQLGYRQEDIIAALTYFTTLSYPATNFNFPSEHWPNFYNNSNPDFAGVANRYDITNQIFQINIRSTSSPINTNTFLPAVFAAHIVKSAFAEEGMQVKGNFFSDPELSQLMVQHNRSLDDVRGQYFLRADSTATFTIIDGVDNRVYFDNDSVLPAVDPPEIYDPNVCEFTIPAAATYEICVSVSLDIPQPQQYGTAAILIFKDATLWANQTFLVSATQSGIIEFTHTFTFVAGPGDVGAVFYVESGYADAINGYLNVDCTAATLSVRSSLYPSDQLHTEADFNRHSTSMNLKNHVPDVTFGKFFAALRGTFNLSAAYIVQEQIVSIDIVNKSLTNQPDADYTAQCTRDYSIEYDPDPDGYTFGWQFPDADAKENFKSFPYDMLVASVITFADLPPAVGNENYFAIVLNQYRVFRSEFDATQNIQIWKYYSDWHFDWVVGNGKIDARVDASPMLMTNKSNVGGQCLMPLTYEQGQSTGFDVGLSSSSAIRWIFWRGMQPGFAGQIYPHASTTQFNFAGNLVGTYQLHFQQSLYGYFWLKWINVLMRGEFIRRFIRLSVADLMKTTDAPKRIGGLNYLITKISTIWGTRVEESEVEMRKL